MKRDFVNQKLKDCITPLAKFPNKTRGDHGLKSFENYKGEKSFTPAAVLIPIVDRPRGLTILLTQRTNHLRDHAGQVSFPGGRVEPNDIDHEATALRETKEEVGLVSENIDLVGRLDRYITRTGFEVIPVVGFVNPPFTIKPDPFEVADIFEVPLKFLANPKNHQLHSHCYNCLLYTSPSPRD